MCAAIPAVDEKTGRPHRQHVECGRNPAGRTVLRKPERAATGSRDLNVNDRFCVQPRNRRGTVVVGRGCRALVQSAPVLTQIPQPIRDRRGRFAVVGKPDHSK